jgi:hypothetical protein
MEKLYNRRATKTQTKRLFLFIKSMGAEQGPHFRPGVRAQSVARALAEDDDDCAPPYRIMLVECENKQILIQAQAMRTRRQPPPLSWELGDT